jgi:succinoglycan biosynthesis protein ExoO
MAPKVSVIIPAYNARNTIAYALESALRQTVHDIEVIVIDDASYDGTPQIVRSFNDSRIKFLCNAQNLGQGTSRNIGLKAASGDYVAFLDADDALHPNYLESLLKEAISLGPKAVLASDNWICNSRMQPLYRMFVLRQLQLSLNTNPISLGELISHRVDIKPFINRQALLQANVWFLDGARGEEWLPFLVNLFVAGFQFFVLDAPLYYYRVHGFNISRTYQGLTREVQALQRLMKKYNLDCEVLKFLQQYESFLNQRAPWVALRCGLVQEFFISLLRNPNAFWFPFQKIKDWCWRMKLLRGLARHA